MACRPEVTGRRVRQLVNVNPETTWPETADAYSVGEFCRRHRISVAMFYKLRAQGLTPAEFKVGTRTLISRESAAAWRVEREQASREARHQCEAEIGAERPHLLRKRGPIRSALHPSRSAVG
jgi:hypothetical protein